MYELLLIDNDTEMLDRNRKYFEQNRFIVNTAENAQKGLIIIKNTQPDCIILDLMMSNIDGLSACRKYRSITKAPIIFLTEKSSEHDKLKAFELGADDYLEKPFSLKELNARIMANIRRSQSYCIPSQLHFGLLNIHITEHTASYNGKIIPLSNREYDLLYLLASKPNSLITFEEIGYHIWGSYNESDRRSVMVHISRLRKKLESYDHLETLIETVWSKGYRFNFHFSHKAIEQKI